MIKRNNDKPVPSRHHCWMCGKVRRVITRPGGAGIKHAIRFCDTCDQPEA